MVCTSRPNPFEVARTGRQEEICRFLSLETGTVVALIDVSVEADEHLAFKLLLVVARGFLDTRVCPDEVDEVSKTGVDIRVCGGGLVGWTVYGKPISFGKDIGRNLLSRATLREDALDDRPKTVKGRNTILLHSNIEELVHLEIDHGDNDHIKYRLWARIGLLHPIRRSPAERQVLEVRVFLHFSSVEYVKTDSGEVGKEEVSFDEPSTHAPSWIAFEYWATEVELAEVLDSFLADSGGA